MVTHLPYSPSASNQAHEQALTAMGVQNTAGATGGARSQRIPTQLFGGRDIDDGGGGMHSRPTGFRSTFNSSSRSSNRRET